MTLKYFTENAAFQLRVEKTNTDCYAVRTVL